MFARVHSIPFSGNNYIKMTSHEQRPKILDCSSNQCIQNTDIVLTRSYRVYRNENSAIFSCIFVMRNSLKSCLPLAEME